MEVDIFPYTEGRESIRRRGRQRVTAPAQRNLNDKNAKRYFRLLLNANFDETGFHVTLTYAPGNEPQTMEAAERAAGNFLRRVKARRKKEGLPAMRYAMITDYGQWEDGSSRNVRIHHHIVMDGAMDRRIVRDLWRFPRRAGQETGDKIGRIQAAELELDDRDLGGLAKYLLKNPNGKKRWSCSQNLVKPEFVKNDSKWSRRRVERICREGRDREFWDQYFAQSGYKIIREDDTIRYEYHEETGWHIYLRLRKEVKDHGRKHQPGNAERHSRGAPAA